MPRRYTTDSELREGVEVFTLSESGMAVAEIAPSLGNNCFSFRTAAPLLEEVSFADFLSKPTSYGIPVLFPFPNRIRDGRFTFEGETFTVDPPRHGFIRDKPWRVVSHGASDEAGAWLTSGFDAADYPDQILRQFPFPFRIEITHSLKEGRLTIEATARNSGQRRMPVGFGIHPYFRRPDRGLLTVPAAARWELSDSLPTGRIGTVEGDYDLREGKSLDGLTLDDIYTSVEADADGLARCMIVDEEGGTETVVEFSAERMPHVVVYTPPAPRRSVCVEPNSCPTDAFNLQAKGIESDVISLGAGEEVRFEIGIYTWPLDR
ncbi:MAG TPA: aldose 1-epimerase [Pyrinomonadaceae bacterium]|nr:aldose 1-epimerase [Pyrinomonadaceae bacterium]